MPGEEHCRRLHEDRRTACAKEEHAVDAFRHIALGSGVDLCRERHRSRLDLQEPVGIEIEHVRAFSFAWQRCSSLIRT